MNEVAEEIAREIRRKGGIPFSRFMELALYCPVYGYYEKEGDTIGRRGDYCTSVSVGSLFGELLACQFAGWLSGCGGVGETVQIVEAGAHDGRLARDILTWMGRQRPELFTRLEYWIVEPSPRRQDWQRRGLAEFGGTVRWTVDFDGFTGPRGGEVRGVIFANELLDALPVQRLGWDARERTWFEWGVTLRDGQFDWERMAVNSGGGLKKEALACGRRPGGPFAGPEHGSEAEKWTPHPIPLRFGPDSGCRDFAEQKPADWRSKARGEGETPPIHLPEELLDVLPDGFTTEVGLAAEVWWRKAAAALKRGTLLEIDYGLVSEQFFVPERKDGTLRAYHHHGLTADVLARPGEQDITAHVNFSALEVAGEEAGLRTDAFQTQAQFLTAIAARVWNGATPFGEWSAMRTRQFQTLTHPEHFGRQFRALVQSRAGRL